MICRTPFRKQAINRQFSQVGVGINVKTHRGASRQQSEDDRTEHLRQCRRYAGNLQLIAREHNRFIS